MKAWISVFLVGGLVAACADLPRPWAPLVMEPAVCADRRFDVYFDEGMAMLSREAQAMIATTAEAMNHCSIHRVEVLGLASHTGGASANQSLSERRALAVAEAFEANGWPAPAFDLVAAGEAGAIVAPGVAEPLRRRVEVVVKTGPGQ